MGFLDARKRAGLTLEDVGRRLGVTPTAISFWERGKSVPDARRLPEIAKLYDCTIEELLVPDKEADA